MIRTIIIGLGIVLLVWRAGRQILRNKNGFLAHPATDDDFNHPAFADDRHKSSWQNSLGGERHHHQHQQAR